MITIGIPFYNDAQYLDLAIRSVFNQTYTDWELILADDGGADGSLAIAKKYAADPRITIVSDGLNKKLPARLNQLIDMTETKYFARMDADDIMHPERLAVQLDILEKNPDIDVLGTNAYIIDEDNRIVGVRQVVSDELVSVASFIHPSVMAKTSWYKKNKYDENAIRVEDAMLWQSTRQHSIFKATNLPLLFYREVAGGYYKKYWSSSKSIINGKLIFNSMYSKSFLLRVFFLNGVKGCIYYLQSILGDERKLIEKRNVGKLSRAVKESAENTLNFSLKRSV